MQLNKIIDLKVLTDNHYSFELTKTMETGDIKLNFVNIDLIFKSYTIFKCGYPNEEIYMHSKLYMRNDPLKYCIYEVTESAWVKEIMETNRVHDRHDDSLFKDDKHFIIYFEDEVFECIAKSVIHQVVN